MAFDGHPYSDPLEMALKRELQVGERVLWKGKPLARIRYAAFWLYIFAIPWTAFSVMWTVMAFSGVDSMRPGGLGFLAYAFPLFGMPFILVGLGMMAPPFMPIFNARKTLYAVTDRRVIELNLGRKQLATQSYDASQLGSIQRSEDRDGAGTLKIEAGTRHDSDGDLVTNYFGIVEVADVKKVETTIRTMLEQLKRREQLGG